MVFTPDVKNFGRFGASQPFDRCRCAEPGPRNPDLRVGKRDSPEWRSKELARVRGGQGLQKHIPLRHLNLRLQNPTSRGSVLQ